MTKPLDSLDRYTKIPKKAPKHSTGTYMYTIPYHTIPGTYMYTMSSTGTYIYDIYHVNVRAHPPSPIVKYAHDYFVFSDFKNLLWTLVQVSVLCKSLFTGSL